MTHPERIPDPLTALLREGSNLDERAAADARAAFLERVDLQIREKKSRGPKYWVAPLALAAAALLALLVWPEGSLTYEVEGAAEESGYIRASASAPATIRFTDDTEVLATPGSRLRIVETTSSGARVSVEQGEVTVRVTHTDGSTWNFAAGPFSVRVTGTRFDLVWNPEAERIQVDLHEGSVEIDGYAGSGPVVLEAGQRFVGDARVRTMQVSLLSATLEQEAAPNEAATTSSTSRPSAPEEPGEAPSVDASETKPGDSTERKAPQGPTSWSQLVSKGRFQEVVAAADEQGVGRCLSSCGADDLGALADAARYTGKADLAEKSLIALRSRFQGATKTRAAFLLGRLHEGLNQMDGALTWYETSLREAPSGAYSGESLAGKMRTVLSLSGREAAKPLADQYLKRYPSGVHSVAAKKILQP